MRCGGSCGRGTHWWCGDWTGSPVPAAPDRGGHRPGRAGVGFRSLREALDTTTPGGRLVFHLFGALAQFEREIIRDRTMARLAAARARGRFGGRRSKLSADQRRTARKLYDERELTVAQIREGPRGQPHVDLPGARQGRGRSGGRV